MQYKLAQLIDVPIGQWSEHTIQTRNGQTSIMVKREQAKWLAYINECPHQGRRMNYATNAFLETPDGQLVCPAHGATFSANTGFCTSGPCAGQSLTQLVVSFDNKGVFVELI